MRPSLRATEVPTVIPAKVLRQAQDGERSRTTGIHIQNGSPLKACGDDKKSQIASGKPPQISGGPPMPCGGKRPRNDVKLSDFDFTLAKDRIAVYPPKDRASAKLLCVNRKTGAFRHSVFRDILQILKPGDLLVLNNTKVIPARIFGKRESGGKVEGLLLKEIGENEWEVLLRSGGRIKDGAILKFGENGTRVDAQVLNQGQRNTGQRKIRFLNVGARSPRPVLGGETTPLRSILDQIGHIPLPPYIDRPDAEIDRERYQTVFAEKKGAVASPTAGLHFDEALLEALKKKGIEIAYVTLHVGYGTFQPIISENLSEHTMFEEEFELSEAAAKQISKAKSEGRRIIACGTTAVRVLETVGAGPCARPNNNTGAHGGVPLQPMRGKTRLFIYPPYEFKIVDGLITNFHLPKSTLLLLVAAFMEQGVGARSPRPEPGGETPPLRLLDIYREAIQKDYRFYSYGDAMMVL